MTSHVPKKFNRITASYPVLNHICRSAVPLFGRSHVGKRYIILFFKIKNGNQRVLNDNFRHYVIDALSFGHKRYYNSQDYPFQ